MINDCTHFLSGQGGASGGVPERHVPPAPTPPRTKKSALRRRQNRLGHCSFNFFPGPKAGSVAVFALAIGLLAGCTASVQELDTLEFNYPAVRKARLKLREGDNQAALELLQKAIDEKPALAQAHLEAAQLYDNFARNYVRAIYHYERYLELRPQTEKKEMIEGFIRKAKIAYAAVVVNQDPALEKKVEILQEENNRLKLNLRKVRENLARQIAASEPARPAPKASKAPVVEPAAELSSKGQSAIRRYEVERGDTLSRVAARFYQNPHKWKLIYDANQDVLRGSQQLRPGQVLIIPPR